ncbi:hypothetical protein Tco_0858039 [Tanacetum coccineum]|uniref:Uncharacterized protein n=1 Tax=Tanacetum coccineum TaxID=301880 RepID=A0ABQ5BA62_9ASTR
MLRKQNKVDDSHYDMPLIYFIEGHSLHFGRLEFALITGLPFGTVSFGLYTSGELKFRNKVFPHKLGLSVTNLDVIGVIEDEETFGRLCDEDPYVLARERNDEFNEDFSIKEELRLCLEVEEKTCLEQEKKLLEEKRFRLEEAKRLRSNVVVESFKLHKELQDDELEKSREMMKLISETQLKALKKISFIAKLRRASVRLTCPYILIQDRLPALLDGADVFDNIGIHRSDYSLTFRLADNVPKQDGDDDMNNMYDMAKKYGLFDLHIAHIPKNLAEYYYKNLTFDASDEEVTFKLKTHEKRKRDAGSMSPEELVAWAEEEAGSLYLRTPLIKPKIKGIEFPCKNLFGDFLHYDSVADEVVVHDNWKYEGLSLDGYIDVGGFSTCCDLVHESVVYNGPSLSHIDKECFEKDVVLDVVGSFVPDTIGYTLPLLLKKKGRNKVNVTRKRTCLNRSKIIRLRKGLGKRVACGENNRRLGSLIGLNEHEAADDPQVTT